MVSISSHTNLVKKRNSSVELFRILATFLVIIVHFNGWFAGGLSERFDFADISAFKVGQVVIEGLSCFCVNMFLVISGYFGVKLKLKTYLNLYFILLSIYLPSSLLVDIFHGNLGLHTFHSSVLPFSSSGYFMQCYMMLLFLSPILNSFIKRFGKKILLYTMIFLLIEFWAGCITNVDSLYIEGGYSLFHFILMYMVARCIYLYKDEVTILKSKYYVYGYLSCSLGIVILYIFHVRWAFDYSDPLNILGSVLIFIPFIKKRFYSRKINAIAGSTLSVYILQVTAPYIGKLRKIDNFFLVKYSYGEYLVLSLIVIIFFFSYAIIYDKMRKIITDPIQNFIIKKVKKYGATSCFNCNYNL